MQGKKHYQEKLFTSFQLSDRIPQDNLYRQLKESLSLEFLYKLTAPYYGSEGNPSIDPVVFFKLMLVGYLENLQSDRAIIRSCSLRMDILYFIGYNIDEQLPWHSTLSRTRQLYGAEVFKEVFKKILGLCVEKGMVPGRGQAVDSVLVKANASLESLEPRALDDRVEDYVQQLSAHEEKRPDAGPPLMEQQGNQQGDRGVKVFKADQAKRGRPTAPFAKKLSNKTHYNPTDPDAKIARKPGKPREMTYLGQAGVDLCGHVITHIQADLADKKDSECLNQIIDQTIDTLKERDLVVEQLVCDGNYSSGSVLKHLEAKGITGYIPNFGGYKAHREGFTYDPQGDYYQCSQGKILSFKRIKQDSRGQHFREYRSSASDCKGCPLRPLCIGKTNHKQIIDTVDKVYFQRMDQRMKTPYARWLKKRRQSTVEPVIGTLVHYTGMRTIRTKGIEQANKCMLMAATAYNLKKWLKFKAERVKSGAMILKKDITVQTCRSITGLYGQFSGYLTDLICLCGSSLLQWPNATQPCR